MTVVLFAVQCISLIKREKPILYFVLLLKTHVFCPLLCNVQGMEKGFSFRKKNVPPTQKEVFKELNAEIKGRDSPESGSLYSDYESGQQYEDKVSVTNIVS